MHLRNTHPYMPHLVAKFTQNPVLCTQLLKTTGEIVEASPYDRIWGIGFNKWGQNVLGKMLTQVRTALAS